MSSCYAPEYLSSDYLFTTAMMGKSPYDLGNYDVCNNATGVAKYCLMDAAGVVFGICIPSSCTPPADVTNSTTQLLSFLLSQIEFLVFLDPEDATYTCGDNVIPISTG